MPGPSPICPLRRRLAHLVARLVLPLAERPYAASPERLRAVGPVRHNAALFVRGPLRFTRYVVRSNLWRSLAVHQIDEDMELAGHISQRP